MKYFFNLIFCITTILITVIHPTFSSSQSKVSDYNPSCITQLQKKCIQLAEKHLVEISKFPGATFIDGAVAIEASRSECTAPCGIHFKADVVGDFGTKRPFHDLAYHWHFGDTGAEFEVLPNNFMHSRNTNIAQGPYSGHVYRKPGTYSILLRVSHKNGRTSHAMHKIKVLDASKIYTGLSTICVSQNNDFDGCPQKARYYKSIGKALKRASKRNDKTPYRILLRAGEEFYVGSTAHFRDAGPRYLGRFGQGNNPKIIVDKRLDIFRVTNVPEFTFTGIDGQGNYDPATGQGSSHDARFLFFWNSDNITVYKSRMAGMGINLLFQGGYGAVVSETEITDWYDYGLFNGAWDFDGNGNITDNERPRKHAFVGNYWHQNLKAVSGPGAKDRKITPRWADHGPVRLTRAFQTVISQCSFFSNTGWSSNGDGHQPTIRWNTSGDAGHSGVINKNQLKGGFLVLSSGTQNGHTPANLGRLIIERNFILGTPNTVSMFEAIYGNTTIRNNIALMPNLPDDKKLIPFQNFLRFELGKQSENNKRAPIEVYGNTFIQLQADNPKALTPYYKADSGRLNVSTFANLIYSPYTPDRIYIQNPSFDKDYKPTASFSNRESSTNKLFDTFYGQLRVNDKSFGATNR